jgi:hypothetical protein
MLSLAMSCSDALSPEQRQIKDLETAHKLWQTRNLHTYAFTLQRSCFCGNTDPLYVVVLNDRIGGVFDLNTGAFVDVQSGKTIEDLFAFIQTAIDHHASVIRAEYDAASGFPTEIDYDGAAMIADDEVSFRTSDVHPITPQSAP